MMKICKEHHKILLREVEDHPELWYSIFCTIGFWFVPEPECEICDVLRKEGL